MVCCIVLKQQICYDNQRAVNRLNLQFLEIDALSFNLKWLSYLSKMAGLKVNLPSMLLTLSQQEYKSKNHSMPNTAVNAALQLY